MSEMVLYFLHSTSVLLFHIDVVIQIDIALTISIEWMTSYFYNISALWNYMSKLIYIYYKYADWQEGLNDPLHKDVF